MNTQPGDEFTPAGVDPQSWVAFEGRIQQRRFRSLLENIESCIDQGDLASARAALDEARTLRPDAPELSRLEARVSGHGANVWRRDFHLWGRVLTGASILLAVAGLLLAGESAFRSDTAHRLAGGPALPASAAPVPSVIRDNGAEVTGSSGSASDLPNAAASPSNVRPLQGAVSAPPAAPARQARTAASGVRRPEGIARAATPPRQAFGVTESSANGRSPASATSLLTLQVSPATPTEGAPVSLTVTVAVPTGDPAPRVIVDWGDGTNQDIGVVPTVRTVTHAYAGAGAFAITASATWDGETTRSR